MELGHNNSLLIMGPRGSGKSLAVERAVATMSAKYNNNASNEEPVIGVVRLTGWAHNEERVAFKEMARQLCDCFRLTFSKSASFGDNIDFLRTLLTSLARAQKVIIFILDEFDLFAKRVKQTLLYNLLDSLQSSGVQAAVVGLTVRQDAVELLEKRVKSRFSHRQVDVVPPTMAIISTSDNNNNSSTGDGALDIFKSMMTLPPNSRIKNTLPNTMQSSQLPFPPPALPPPT